MFKSIFGKQFVCYSSALIVSFFILTMALAMAFNHYFITQKAEILEEQGRKISEIYKQRYYGNISFFQAQNGLINEINVLSEYLDASCIFVNKNFMIIGSTENLSHFINRTIEMRELEPLLESRVVMIKGKLGGIFSEPVLTVGYPIVIDGVMAGAVLMSSSMPEVERSISDMFKTTVICLLASLLIATGLVFVFSRTISKPLSEMNEAAKIIANGNFQNRIGVSSGDEVGQLAKSFNNMAGSLYEQDRLRHDFITNVSHDLRSPLTSIRGFIQAILDGTIPQEKHEHYLRIVLDETERLSKLTHDIIDLNKVQTAEVQLEKTEFDINELIRKTVFLFENRIVEKNLKLDLSFADEEDFVYADAEKVERIVYNLLDNAIKFTEVEGSIHIETSVTEYNKDKKVSISVRDTGKGIREEDQKQVFERFFKADESRGEDRMGSGLGLAIVVAFVKAHNETISLKSKEGVGSEFTFLLPLAEVKKMEFKKTENKK